MKRRNQKVSALLLATFLTAGMISTNALAAEEGAATTDLTSYADLDKVSTWAVDALTWAVQNDIIGGKVRDDVSYLEPKESTTRGECATMMMRYVELAKE